MANPLDHPQVITSNGVKEPGHVWTYTTQETYFHSCSTAKSTGIGKSRAVPAVFIRGGRSYEQKWLSLAHLRFNSQIHIFLFFRGGTTSASEPSEATSDLRFVDRVLRVGRGIEAGSPSSEGGAMEVGEDGNSRGRKSDLERFQLDPSRIHRDMVKSVARIKKHPKRHFSDPRLRSTTPPFEIYRVGYERGLPVICTCRHAELPANVGGVSSASFLMASSMLVFGALSVPIFSPFSIQAHATLKPTFKIWFGGEARFDGAPVYRGNMGSKYIIVHM
ncbi:hypothetical protein DFH09DRAFT_1102074 [Mycena vulgaris]|nr:hypothetical protein DFH09DRAFT_1102074 [Mycena vulgaris]